MTPYEVLARALEADPPERRRVVEQACEGDAALRDRLLAMLEQRERIGDFLETPAAARLDLLAAPGPPLAPGTEVGRYRLGRVIASGGSGTVYEAIQESPRRKVALKVMAPGLGSTGTADRLREEAEILARLSHPGVAHVYEAGVHESLPWLALEYVEGGQDLLAHAREAGLPVRARLDLMARVCDAVHHGHEHGILHGDLKPSNLLVDAAGRPKVIDFGIARVLGADGDGGLAGTPGYMSPEQCEGGAGADVRSDVYSLGAVLYELLAGRPACDVADLPLAEALDAVRAREPARIETVDPRLRGDVAAIVHKALARDRGVRYASAAALADDLRRRLAHRPVEARPPRPLYVAGRFARRAPLVTALLLAIVALLVVGGLGGARLAYQKEREREAAERQAYVASLAAASAALRAHDVAEARRQLGRAPEELRGWEWRHLFGRLDDSERTFPIGLRPVKGGAVSADGRRAVALGAGHGVAVLDLETGRQLYALDGRPPVYCAAFAPSGDRFALGYWSGAIEIRDAATGDVRLALGGHPPGDVPLNRAGPPVTIDVAFDPSGRMLASAGRDGTVRLWDAETGAALSVIGGHADRVIAVAFAPDGARLAAAGRDGTVRVFDVATGAQVHVLSGHESSVQDVAWSPDGRRLVSTCRDGTVRLWDAWSGALVALRHEHANSARTVAFAPDGSAFATVSWDRTLRFWNGETGRAQGWLHGHETAIQDVAWTPGGVVTFGGDVRLWRPRRREEVPVLYGHRDLVCSVAFSPDGRTLASMSRDGSLRLWDPVARREIAERSVVPNYFPRTSFLPDGALVGAGAEGAFRWELDAAGRPVGPGVSLGPAGHRVGGRLLAGQMDGRVHAMDVATGAREIVPVFEAGVSAAAPDPARLRFAVASRAGEVAVLDTATLALLARARPRGSSVQDLAFSPDGTTLATASDDGGLLLDAATLRTIATLEGVEGVAAVAFHPDGTRLATAGQDGTVRIWDARTGETLLVLHGPRFPVWCVAWSPDGRRLASGEGAWEGHDSCIRLWEELPETR